MFEEVVLLDSFIYTFYFIRARREQKHGNEINSYKYDGKKLAFMNFILPV
jgi:hypothetical protein